MHTLPAKPRWPRRTCTCTHRREEDQRAGYITGLKKSFFNCFKNKNIITKVIIRRSETNNRARERPELGLEFLQGSTHHGLCQRYRGREVKSAKVERGRGAAGQRAAHAPLVNARRAQRVVPERLLRGKRVPFGWWVLCVVCLMHSEAKARTSAVSSTFFPLDRGLT
jgi:hypothetical protein